MKSIFRSPTASNNGSGANGHHRANGRAGGNPSQRSISQRQDCIQRPLNKVALVLAGGGITGAVYEIGALRAIDEMLEGLSVNDFDIYVGTSAGALVSALIVNGLTPSEIIQSIDNQHPEIGGFHVGDVLHANYEGYFRRLVNLPRALWQIGVNTITHSGDVAISDLLWELSDLLPSGIYDGNALERYMRRILEMPDRCNRFDFLEKQLYIVATELDSGNRAVFGQGGKGVVPISRAVAASSAIPLLYRPVQIFGRDYVDGGLHGTASLDLAIEAGAKLVICINPMVPLNATHAHPNESYIREHGLQAILNQTVRTILHSSLRYHIKNLKVKYPDVDIILIQPGWDDHRMFNYNPMYYGSRMLLVEHGFETVTTGLMNDYQYYRQVLARHGITLRPERAEQQLQLMHASGDDPAVVRKVILSGNHAGHQEKPAPHGIRESLSKLEENLQRLERLVS